MCIVAEREMYTFLCYFCVTKGPASTCLSHRRCGIDSAVPGLKVLDLHEITSPVLFHNHPAHLVFLFAATRVVRVPLLGDFSSRSSLPVSRDFQFRITFQSHLLEPVRAEQASFCVFVMFHLVPVDNHPLHLVVADLLF